MRPPKSAKQKWLPKLKSIRIQQNLKNAKSTWSQTGWAWSSPCPGLSCRSSSASSPSSSSPSSQPSGSDLSYPSSCSISSTTHPSSSHLLLRWLIFCPKICKRVGIRSRNFLHFNHGTFHPKYNSNEKVFNFHFFFQINCFLSNYFIEPLSNLFCLTFFNEL